MPITDEEALAATNPNDSDEAREAAALRIKLGVAAADVYWASRGEIERLFALHGGHAVVTRGVDDVADAIETVEHDAETIEGTAEEVNPAQVAASTPTVTATTPSAAEAAPTNPADTVAKLRAQLQAAGIDPEA